MPNTDHLGLYYHSTGNSIPEYELKHWQYALERFALALAEFIGQGCLTSAHYNGYAVASQLAVDVRHSSGTRGSIAYVGNNDEIRVLYQADTVRITSANCPGLTASATNYVYIQAPAAGSHSADGDVLAELTPSYGAVQDPANIPADAEYIFTVVMDADDATSITYNATYRTNLK